MASSSRRALPLLRHVGALDSSAWRAAPFPCFCARGAPACRSSSAPPPWPSLPHPSPWPTASPSMASKICSASIPARTPASVSWWPTPLPGARPCLISTAWTLPMTGPVFFRWGSSSVSRSPGCYLLHPLWSCWTSRQAHSMKQTR
jgi:hypothetical protein